jgi:alkylation response protein AidB-like acyl-CoA dehydrogenase
LNKEGLVVSALIFCKIQETRIQSGVEDIESTFFGSQLIEMAGTEEQKQKYLPPICAGKMRMGVAITEPDAGSDVVSVSTSARKDTGRLVAPWDSIVSRNHLTSNTKSFTFHLKS